jgi:hypothetical protein
VPKKKGQIMSAQITVTLPEDVLERAEVLARRTGQPVSDLLAETISLSLKPLGTARGQTEDLGAKSNEEVLAASQTEMPPAEDERLSLLLDRQQAGTLTDAERADLTGLMQLYQDLLLRKAQALRLAVQRGLRGPLQP